MPQAIGVWLATVLTGYGSAAAAAAAGSAAAFAAVTAIEPSDPWDSDLPANDEHRERG